MSWSLCIDNIAKINNRLDEECKKLIGNKMDEMIKNSLFIHSEFCKQLKAQMIDIDQSDDRCLDSLFDENKSLICQLGKKYAKIIKEMLEYKNGRSCALYDEMHKIAKRNNLCGQSPEIIKEEKEENGAMDDEDESTESENDENNEYEPYTPTINLYCPHLDCFEFGEVFHDHRSFENHMIHDHGDGKPYHCNQCGAYFSKKRSLTEHIERIHQKRVKFKCNQCGKTFYNRTHWMDHCRVHRGIMYECNECEKTFVRKGGLRKHTESIHQNKVNYQCNDCGQGFYDRTKWTDHCRVHRGIKYECIECFKAFRTKYELTVHFRTHSGAKPYECSKCHKRFRQAGHKNEHQKRCNN